MPSMIRNLRNRFDATSQSSRVEHRDFRSRCASERSDADELYRTLRQLHGTHAERCADSR